MAGKTIKIDMTAVEAAATKHGFARVSHNQPKAGGTVEITLHDYKRSKDKPTPITAAIAAAKAAGLKNGSVREVATINGISVVIRVTQPRTPGKKEPDATIEVIETVAAPAEKPQEQVA